MLVVSKPPQLIAGLEMTSVFVADQDKIPREQADGQLTYNHITDVHQPVIDGTSMFQTSMVAQA